MAPDTVADAATITEVTSTAKSIRSREGIGVRADLGPASFSFAGVFAAIFVIAVTALIFLASGDFFHYTNLSAIGTDLILIFIALTIVVVLVLLSTMRK